jgi:hypothetical protein
MLTLIAASMGVEHMLPADPDRAAVLRSGWANLTANNGTTGRYIQNILNLKITVCVCVAREATS